MPNDRLHIKCKINHVYGHLPGIFSYKYSENGDKFNFIYFYWQKFKKISDYFLNPAQTEW